MRDRCFDAEVFSTSTSSFFFFFADLRLFLSPPHHQQNHHRQAKTATTTCDDACQRHVKLAEGAILALTVGAALAAGAGFLHAIDTPTRFLGGTLEKAGVGGGGAGDGGN